TEKRMVRSSLAGQMREDRRGTWNKAETSFSSAADTEAGLFSRYSSVSPASSALTASVGPGLGFETVDGQRLEAHRAVGDAVSVLEIEGVLEPVHVVALGEIGAVVRAAALLARFRRDQRGHRRLDQVVELERLDARRVERLRLVPDPGTGRTRGDLLDLRHPLREHVREAEHAAVRLHGSAHVGGH